MMYGLTQSQYAAARERQDEMSDAEWYEELSKLNTLHEEYKTDFLAAHANLPFEMFAQLPVPRWDGIGGAMEHKFLQYAVKRMREKYATSGELLDVVREEFAGVEA